MLHTSSWGPCLGESQAEFGEAAHWKRRASWTTLPSPAGDECALTPPHSKVPKQRFHGREAASKPSK